MPITEGPWRIKDDYTREGRLTIIAETDIDAFEFVASLADEFDETHERTDANRQAITKLPEMIAAARALVWQHFHPHDPLPGEPNTIGGAIRKLDAVLKSAGIE
jgi:hypothetical protein